MEIGDFINENVPLFIGLFVGVSVIIVTLLIVFSIKSNVKKKNMLKENPNLVEIVFDTAVFTPKPINGGYEGYLLYSVNGKLVEPIGRSIVVSAGEITLDVENFMRTVGKTFANSYGRSSYTFTATPGKKYTMSFNYIDHCLMHKEKG